MPISFRPLGRSEDLRGRPLGAFYVAPGENGLPKCLNIGIKKCPKQYSQQNCLGTTNHCSISEHNHIIRSSAVFNIMLSIAESIAPSGNSKHSLLSSAMTVVNFCKGGIHISSDTQFWKFLPLPPSDDTMMTLWSLPPSNDR